ncbi:MAG: AMP-binding protein [Chloroflexi bacterium]|nr:AMP-binding protein [Chloroflexota bacterium]
MTYRNLGELVGAASEQFADDVAFQVRRGLRLERYTFRAAGDGARRVAAWLNARGITAGERLVVWSPNMPEYAMLYFGAWTAGVVVVPIDVRTGQEILDRFVAAAEPRMAFKSRHLAGRFGPPVAETFDLEDLLDLVADMRPLASVPDIPSQSLCEIAFTSGTTGVPKGVMLTHGNFLAEIAAMRQAFPLKRSYRALSVLPLSHALEQIIDLLLAYTFGVRMTHVPSVNAVTISRALREEGTTCLILVPQLLRMLLTGIERRAREENEALWTSAHAVAERIPFPLRRVLFGRVHRALGGHLEFFGSGGAPLDLKVAAAWQRMGVHILEGYGLTETSAASTINSWRAQRLGTVGQPIPGVDVRISGDGEILIRGPTVSPGYFGNEELTSRSFVDGWLQTGDIGSLDADGFLRISGRAAFKIVLPDGRNVYPEDVEQTLNLHPLVRESCVVGVERNDGEAVYAALLTTAPERADEIIRESNRRLAAHQQIRGYTIWQEADFPRTATLKVDRVSVREAVERDRAAVVGERPGRPGPPGDPLIAVIARAAERPSDDVRDGAELEGDLGLDSIGRIELLAAIEEEMGRVVDELAVGPQTTIAELRALVAAGSTSREIKAPPRWPRTWWARMIGSALLWIAFRLQDRWMRLDVVHPDRAASLPVPSLVIFNYQGPYAPLVLLRALPAHVRSRVAVAVDPRIWKGRDRWQGLLAALAAQAFSFAKSGGTALAGLEELGRWLDDGYAVIISPEGEPELDGALRPFLNGTGLMAVEMRVPIVPFKLEHYHRLFPRDQSFPYLPNKPGTVRLIVGEPLTLPKGTTYRDATEAAERALVDAH